MTYDYMLDEHAVEPIRAHGADAGLDLFCMDNYSRRIWPGDSAMIDTGVHIDIPDGYCGFIKTKSGMNTKYNLVCEGVVDAGYLGSIVVNLHNNGGEPYTINPGQKVAQIVFLPVETPKLRKVSSFRVTARGNNGFGSTGMK